MIVISDTTPIISLLKVQQLQLLQRLYGTILIPNAVYRELTENPSFAEEAKREGMILALGEWGKNGVHQISLRGKVKGRNTIF